MLKRLKEVFKQSTDKRGGWNLNQISMIMGQEVTMPHQDIEKDHTIEIRQFTKELFD